MNNASTNNTNTNNSKTNNGTMNNASTNNTNKNNTKTNNGVTNNTNKNNTKTTIVDGAGEEASIKARFDTLQEQYDNAESDYEKQTIRERMNKLVGGVAIINIGASSEVELKEKKDRVDDALHATRAAVEEGIVAGGGMALIYVAEDQEYLTQIDFDNPDQQLS